MNWKHLVGIVSLFTLSHIRAAAVDPSAAFIREKKYLNTIFGPTDVSHPLVQKLLNHKVMTRLKFVDQHGPSTYYGNVPTFSRYKHSVGVYALLQRFGRPFNEQIAGLLHDASHTTFSHVADRFFRTGNHAAYQDGIHAWYLKEMGLSDTLLIHNITIDDVLADHPDYLPLKQKLPAMNADRIQYNLETALAWNRLSQEEIDAITSSLRLDGPTWYFVDATHAKQFAEQSLFFTQNFWGAPDNTAWHHWIVEAMQRAVELNIFSLDDFHFGQDLSIVASLDDSTDPVIVSSLTKCRNRFNCFKVVSKDGPYDLDDFPKFRGINPLVEQEDGTRVTLTEIDDEFAAEFNRIKNWCESGFYIKFIEPEKSESLILATEAS